jgi:hypothetical protein
VKVSVLSRIGRGPPPRSSVSGAWRAHCVHRPCFVVIPSGLGEGDPPCQDSEQSLAVNWLPPQPCHIFRLGARPLRSTDFPFPEEAHVFTTAAGSGGIAKAAAMDCSGVGVVLGLILRTTVRTSQGTKVGMFARKGSIPVRIQRWRWRRGARHLQSRGVGVSLPDVATAVG